ncbi:Detected protein of unknown function [Hibiscus syriacus]|uniref:Polygalacturonase n=1 Tax=Hibiscus syriacus TaxID=106335 RepID=A0A6A2ZL10_HIBSY|nr:Detected protein of unknown function [Hibiscus syriacus]
MGGGFYSHHRCSCRTVFGWDVAAAEAVRAVGSRVEAGAAPRGPRVSNPRVSLWNHVDRHGISIGSLGKDNTKACVSNITVRDIIMHNTMNGVRIKTWQVASKQFLAYNFKSLLQGGSGNVQGVLFSNIQVSEVQLPIVIDQFYCDKRTCKNQTAAVSLSGITYERIRGTYTVKLYT